MRDAFIAGGWGMYPTLIAGLALLATCLRYASHPESRHVPLMLTLGLFTLFAGSLGFITGVMACLSAYADPSMASAGPTVLYLGIQESLHNVALALLLTTTAAIAASIGAWRLSRQVEAATVPVR